MLGFVSFDGSGQLFFCLTINYFTVQYLDSDLWFPFDLEQPDFHVTAEVKTLGSDNKPLYREDAGMAA